MINLGTHTRWLPDCTAADLDLAAEIHEEVSRGHMSSADQMKKLAGMVRRRKGATVVGDLDEDKVRGVLGA